MKFEKLDPEFKAKWIAALRSGKYKQGRKRLYTPSDNSYCCLGVAGVVCGVPIEILNKSTYLRKGLLENYFDYIPKQLRGDGENELVASLTQRNDGDMSTKNPSGKQLSFNQIADWVEKNL